MKAMGRWGRVAALLGGAAVVQVGATLGGCGSAGAADEPEVATEKCPADATLDTTVTHRFEGKTIAELASVHVVGIRTKPDAEGFIATQLGTIWIKDGEVRASCRVNQPLDGGKVDSVMFVLP